MNKDKKESEKNTEAGLSIIEPAKNKAVLKLQEAVIEVRDYAMARTVSTLEEAKDATKDLSIMSNMKKDLEAYRQGYVKPLQSHIDDINAFFKLISGPLAEADKVTRDKMIAYDAEQRRIRAEQERINALRFEAAQKEMKLKGELSESVNLVEVTPEPAKHISTDMGSAGMVDRWKWEVVDFSQIPDEYKMVDNSLLTAVARKHHDQKPIPGVRFFNEPYIAMRPR